MIERNLRRIQKLETELEAMRSERDGQAAQVSGQWFLSFWSPGLKKLKEALVAWLKEA